MFCGLNFIYSKWCSYQIHLKHQDSWHNIAVIDYYQIHLCSKDFSTNVVYQCLSNRISGTTRSKNKREFSKFSMNENISRSFSLKKNYWDALIPLLCNFLSLSLCLENCLWGLKILRVMWWELVQQFILFVYSTSTYCQALCSVLGWQW